MLLCDAVSAAKRVERFLEALANAGENRRIAQREARAFGFAERHHEIQEVFRLIAFKRHHPFLVIQPEGIGRVQLHRGEAMPDFDVFVHHALPRRFREQEPFARLEERVDENILGFAWNDGQTLALLIFVGVMIHVDRALGDREIGVGSGQVLSQPRCQYLRGHVLEQFQLVADPPQHDVAIAPDPDRGVRNHEDLAGIVLDRTHEFLFAFGAFTLGEAPPGRVDFIEGEVHILAFRCLGRWGLFRGRHRKLLRITS